MTDYTVPLCDPCAMGRHSWHGSRTGVCTRRTCRCTYNAHKRDIYADLCGDENQPQKFSGGWVDRRTSGGCNACYSGDFFGRFDEKVFEFKANGLVMRLCEGHLKRLFELSRYQ